MLCDFAHTKLMIKHYFVSKKKHVSREALKETHNSFKKWPLNLWWISNKTIMEVGNITKAATSKSFFHLSYKNTKLLFLCSAF